MTKEQKERLSHLIFIDMFQLSATMDEMHELDVLCTEATQEEYEAAYDEAEKKAFEGVKQ